MIKKPRETSEPAHTTEPNTNIHIANIHVSNIHNTVSYSTETHNSNSDNATMPPNIHHRDLFGVGISYEKKPLTIYNNEDATHEGQGNAPMPTELVGDLFALSNKVLVFPVVLPKSTRTMHMNFNMLPGFDFRSANAVLVGLRVGQMVRGFETILKEDHETKQPNSSSGFHWGRVQLAEASQGTLVVTVTRGIKIKNVQFVPLDGEDGKPYSIEIEWRVVNGRSGGAVGPEYGQLDALHNAMIKPERTATPTQPMVKQNLTKPMISTEQEQSVKSATATTAAKPNPTDDDENKVAPTSFTDPEKPKRRPAVVTDAGSPFVPPTAAPTSQNTEVKFPTTKRNAAEAFGPKQAEADKSIKQQQFRLRKAEAKLDVVSSKLEQTASEVGQDNVAYLRAVFNKAKAVHVVRKAELELKAAELGDGDKKDTEYFKLQTRKAKAHLEVVKAEGMLMAKLELQDSQQ